MNTIKSKYNLLITSGFDKYPHERDIFFKNAELWLRGKKIDDGVYPYWRIHNKLYDLKNFVHEHPGGEFWIEDTQGMDITESFVVSHFGKFPEKVLEKYFVKEILTPRNSPFTFKEEGFYQVLKNKVTPIILKEGKGPTLQSVVLQDSLFLFFLLCLVIGTINNSVAFTALASIFLCLGISSAHNFLHQGNNWRMYMFDFTLMSSREWRISHALSHHPFPNTIYDYEISGFEPFFQVLPKSNKSSIVRYGSLYYGFLIYAFGFFFDVFKRFVLVIMQEVPFRWESCVVIAELISMAVLRGSLSEGLWLWFVLHSITNFLFFFHGIAVAHHHPDIYHEGDFSDGNKDWGIFQILATRQRGELINPFLIAAVTFGNHTLHHLFPTVDHSKLPLLHDAFLETCKEFHVQYEPYAFKDLLKGFYALNANVKPNSPSFRKTKI